MFPADRSSSRPSWRYALAGLQAGALGALAMLAVLMAGSLLTRRSIWSVPNLLATTLYGDHVFRGGFLRSTWAGLALFFVTYAVLGVLWGCVWRDAPRPRLTLIGAVFGLATYYFLFHFAWKHINPIVPLYAPDRSLRVGHVVWGMILARSPRYSRRILQANVETLPAGTEAMEPAPKSGEVIL